MVQTFVFFDLETTDLIRGNKMPKITELSLVAASRDSILNAKGDIPRVLHKLILPIHPNQKIPEIVQQLTNLCDQNLENIHCFDNETYDLIENFIKRLAVPVCFVAHNGNAFDYPIFLWEIQRINRVLSRNILCIDTLTMFKDYYKNRSTEEQVVKDINEPLGSKDFNVFFNDGYNEILSHELDLVMKNYSECLIDDNAVNRISNMQQVNEKTPPNQIIKRNCPQHRHKGVVRRQLNFNDKPINFKLTSVCHHMFGDVIEQAHTAEGDCLIMLRCASKIGSYFVQWADQNATVLVNFKGMQ